MKGRENSMPEKKRMKVRWVRLRRKWELVRWMGGSDGGVGFVGAGAEVLVASADATLLGSVSGR